jgi:hypothetical protein
MKWVAIAVAAMWVLGGCATGPRAPAMGSAAAPVAPMEPVNHALIAQDEMNERNPVGKCLPPLCPNH